MRSGRDGGVWFYPHTLKFAEYTAFLITMDCLLCKPAKYVFSLLVFLVRLQYLTVSKQGERWR